MTKSNHPHTVKVRYIGGPRDGKVTDLTLFLRYEGDTRPGPIGCRDEYEQAGLEPGYYSCTGRGKDVAWEYQWRLVSEVPKALANRPAGVTLTKKKRQ